MIEDELKKFGIDLNEDIDKRFDAFKKLMDELEEDNELEEDSFTFNMTFHPWYEIWQNQNKL